MCVPHFVTLHQIKCIFSTFTFPGCAVESSFYSAALNFGQSLISFRACSGAQICIQKTKGFQTFTTEKRQKPKTLITQRAQACYSCPQYGPQLVIVPLNSFKIYFLMLHRVYSLGSSYQTLCTNPPSAVLKVTVQFCDLVVLNEQF